MGQSQSDLTNIANEITAVEILAGSSDKQSHW